MTDPIGWVLIVHLFGGGYAELHASELGCRLALDEAAIMARRALGRDPGLSCRPAWRIDRRDAWSARRRRAVG